MTRPTIDHVQHTAVLLRVLARDAHPDYHLVASIVDRLAWLDGEIRDAEHAAALGPGPSDIPILGASTAGVEGRLYDPLLRELRRLRRQWRRELGMLQTGITCTACQTRISDGWERGVTDAARHADRPIMA